MACATDLTMQNGLVNLQLSVTELGKLVMRGT